MPTSPSTGSANHDDVPSVGLRFGFYLHFSTFAEDREIEIWRRLNENAVHNMIATHGTVSESYIDDITTEDPQKPPPWGLRPQAQRLLSDLRRNKLDAVAVGSVQGRVFAATAVWDVAALLQVSGKRLWTADINGPLDPADPEHVLYLLVRYGVPVPTRIWRSGTGPAGATA